MIAFGRRYRRGGKPKLQNSQKNRVAELMSQGMATQEIADTLGITRKLVNARISDIRRDLGWQAQ